MAARPTSYHPWYISTSNDQQSDTDIAGVGAAAALYVIAAVGTTTPCRGGTTRCRRIIYRRNPTSTRKHVLNYLRFMSVDEDDFNVPEAAWIYRSGSMYITTNRLGSFVLRVTRLPVCHVTPELQLTHRIYLVNYVVNLLRSPSCFSESEDCCVLQILKFKVYFYSKHFYII